MLKQFSDTLMAILECLVNEYKAKFFFSKIESLLFYDFILFVEHREEIEFVIESL